jgi:hypothetical protein
MGKKSMLGRIIVYHGGLDQSRIKVIPVGQNSRGLHEQYACFKIMISA